MRNIRLFETNDDFVASQESVSGSGAYVEDILPGFAYIRENYPDSAYAKYNGHEEPAPDCDYIDLGLPSGTLWARTNVGAANPEDIGDIFAWAEIIPNKDSYTEANYKYFNTGNSAYTKYQYNGSSDPIELEPEDDAATVNLGSSCGWHMPTVDQWYELYDNTTMTTGGTGPGYEYDNAYFVFTSNINGNSITIPLYPGDYWDDAAKENNALFWTSTFDDRSMYVESNAFLIQEGCENQNGVQSMMRYKAAPVRGVVGESPDMGD